MSKSNRRESNRRVAYFVLVLLILLIIAVIGGLSAVLYSMKPPAPKGPKDLVSARKPKDIKSKTPTAELLIDLPAEEEEKKEEDIPEVQEEDDEGGLIPTVCDGYGPQIQERKAYWGPVTHSARITPTRVTIELNIEGLKPTAGPNNIR
jgi:hypothetical protein